MMGLLEGLLGVSRCCYCTLLAQISGQMLLKGYTLDVVSSDVANLMLMLLADDKMLLIEDVLPGKC